MQDNAFLFLLFISGHQKQVGPELFRVFYTIWKETEAEAQEVCIHDFKETNYTFVNAIENQFPVVLTKGLC